MSIKSKINRDTNSANMHFWSKSGYPNFNTWWVITDDDDADKLETGQYFNLKLNFTLNIKVNQPQN